MMTDAVTTQFYISLDRKSLDSLLVFSTKGTTPVVLVGVAEGVESVYRFLSRCTHQDSRLPQYLLGVISVGPMLHDHAHFWTGPLFVILSSWKQDQKDLRKYLCNPNVIVVVENSTEDDVQLVVGRGEDYHYDVWVARTISKYTEASAAMTSAGQRNLLPLSRL
jgi:hypothetical protein